MRNQQRWWEQEIQGFPEPKIIAQVGDTWENYPPLRTKLSDKDYIMLRYFPINVHGIIGFASLKHAEDEGKIIAIYKDAKVYADLNAFLKTAGSTEINGRPNFAFIVKKQGANLSEFFLDLWMYDSQFDIISKFRSGTRRQDYIPTRNLFIKY